MVVRDVLVKLLTGFFQVFVKRETDIDSSPCDSDIYKKETEKLVE